jgi:hypothetical protein
MTGSLLVTMALAVIYLSPQSQFPDAHQTAAIIQFAENAVARALDYSQGNRRSLIDAKDDFTEDGWREFERRMEGWLDSSGAPLGSSSFAASGAAMIVEEESGRIHLTIPGTLRQRQNKSETTYRVLVDVWLSGNPAKITHLEPIVQLRSRSGAQGGRQ